MDKRTGVLLAVPFVIIAAVLLFLPAKKFAPTLSGAEKDFAAFSTGTVPAIIKRYPVTAVALESPLKIPSVLVQKKEFPGQPLSQVAPPPGQTLPQAVLTPVTPITYVVTLILANNDKKMAIINGIVVKEGGIINDSTVEKIEKNRVLLKNKKESRWLKVE
jgi:hypothetical protein